MADLTVASQRAELNAWQRKLEEQGDNRSAEIVKRLLRSGSAFVSDNNHAAYESGLAVWLTDNCKYSNRPHGLMVYLKREKLAKEPAFGIEYRQRASGDWIAHLSGNPDIWETGSDLATTIGYLIVSLSKHNLVSLKES